MPIILGSTSLCISTGDNQHMKIENNAAVDENDFFLIKKHYGCQIYPDIRHFIAKYNGIIEEPEYGIEIEYKTFKGTTLTDSFCEILHTNVILKILPNLDFINDFFDEDGLTKEQVEPASLLPIFSVAGGGLLIYVSVYGAHKNKLFTVDNGDSGIGVLDIKLDELARRLDVES